MLLLYHSVMWTGNDGVFLILRKLLPAAHFHIYNVVTKLLALDKKLVRSFIHNLCIHDLITVT